MSDDTSSPPNNVITIDDERIKSHLDRVVLKWCTPRSAPALAT